MPDHDPGIVADYQGGSAVPDLDTDKVPTPDIDELSDAMRRQLSSRELMRFELAIGVPFSDIEASTIAQLVFLIWAARLHTDHAISIEDALEMNMDQLTDEVQRIARQYAGKVTGVDEPSPTPTASDSSSSPSSAPRTASPSTPSSG